ncbi:MAG: 4Fe-4S dicluster domain-containing protein [Candidatus Adiutrix sp.]|jgi:ferredoxin|nr:4Fe-4S dicluster domain-containing protein [Candidatus Adiutrix sp.]
MAEYTVKDKLSFLKAAAGSGRRLLAPSSKDGRVRLAEVTPDRVAFDYLNTHLSPKDAFFPQTEKMLAFHKDAAKPGAFVYQPLGLDKIQPTVVFGLRPCDARGLAVCDRVFQNDRFTDPYWKTKYEGAVKIGLACQAPGPNCFCTAVGGSPFGEDGLDVLAFTKGEGLGLKTLTPAGDEFLKGLSGLESGGAAGEMDGLKKAAESRLPGPLDLAKAQAAPVMEIYNQPHWKETADRCLNCGTCTFFCPTCHCFDIQDEENERGGVRMRNWDTCMSWLYTIHGSGHNPRPTKTERVRQRFMHKLKYIPLKQGGACGCVGCGRCVQHCPVNIDIRAVAVDMSK